MERHPLSKVALLAITAALILVAAPAMVAQGGGGGGLTGDTDHFACYEAIPGTPNAPITISLTDACGVSLNDVSAMSVLEICNPAAKTVGGVLTDFQEPNAHLTFYELTQKLPANRRRVSVNNQFGPQILRVAAPRLVAVPSVKNNVGTLASVEDELSHFTCYEASGKRILVNADLQDQFHPAAPETILVHAPQFFCSPADKTRGGVTTEVAREGEDHLVCYKVTPSLTPAGFPSAEVDNQFDANETLTIGPLHFLCVPSELTSCSL